MNSRVIGFALFSAAALFCGFNILHDDGIVGQTKKPLLAPIFLVKGCFCHGDTASSRVRVWISGPESLAAGAEALYSLNVAKDSSVAAGFNIAAFFGDLGIFDTTETQLMRVDPNNPVDSLELTHTDPKLSDGRDTISWSFYYRAPSTVGSVDTIYANGNSVDLSLDPVQRNPANLRDPAIDDDHGKRGIFPLDNFADIIRGAIIDERELQCNLVTIDLRKYLL